MSPGSLLTGSAQIEWNEALLLGDGTDYVVTNLEGWSDLPAIDSGNVDLAGEHGAEPGRPLAQQRIVTATFDIRPPPPTTTEAQLLEVDAATPVSPDGVELSIVVRDWRTLLAFGTVARRNLPMLPGWQRRVMGAAIQWVCSDSRRYSLAEQSTSIPAPTPGVGGLPYPLEYPLNWGTPGVAGLGNAVNNGNAPTFPRVVFNGPVTSPRITNFLTGGAIQVDVDVPAGHHLDIDTRTATALLDGASAAALLSADSVPLKAWTFAAGADNPLVFTGGAFSAEGATCVVSWRSAWW